MRGPLGHNSLLLSHYLSVSYMYNQSLTFTIKFLTFTIKLSHIFYQTHISYQTLTTSISLSHSLSNYFTYSIQSKYYIYWQSLSQSPSKSLTLTVKVFHIYYHFQNKQKRHWALFKSPCPLNEGSKVWNTQCSELLGILEVFPQNSFSFTAQS